jgi:23S rRNA pseudouridine1911/1915/1917 synthase
VRTPPDRGETFVVQDAGSTRLDQFLVARLSGGSRRRARLAIDAGAVMVNGRRGRKGQALHPGDVVRIDIAALDCDLTPQPELHLPILYLDDALIAVDKPAGMPAVALRASDRDTVANGLLGRFPELRGVGGSAFEVGLVHRLDTPTSGVLLAARTAPAWQQLRAQFRARRVDKLYLAVVAGDVPRSGTIEIPIAHHPDRPRQMCACEDRRRAESLHARAARTRYRPLRRDGAATLVAVRIRTGARHQVRVHLAAIGHPLLGDALYADARTAATAPRLLLHAVRLGCTHPLSGRRIVVRSPLPDGFGAPRRAQQRAPR